VVLNHAWNYDVVRYADGTIAALWQARVNGTGTTDPDKRALYARFDGSKWTLTYLVKMGPKLYSSEEDYTSLGALDPDDADDLPEMRRRSTRATTPPPSASHRPSRHDLRQRRDLHLTPLTRGSTMDNLRPSCPSGTPATRRWSGCAGPTPAQSYTLKVVSVLTTKPAGKTVTSRAVTAAHRLRFEVSARPRCSAGAPLFQQPKHRRRPSHAGQREGADRRPPSIEERSLSARPCARSLATWR
jgi:hypothetical protein